MGPCDVAYHLASVHAAFGTLVALFNRRDSGRGEHVEVSLQEVLVADPSCARYTLQCDRRNSARTGHSQSTTVAETYQCKDGYARIFVNQPDHWRRFSRMAWPPPELLDPKYERCKIGFRCARPSIGLMEARTLNYETQKFFEEFQGSVSPRAPINPPSAFLADEQSRRRKYLTSVEHRGLVSISSQATPINFPKVVGGSRARAALW
jgi:crotonobetainyl-CoA:carnitine CoA-transferase CaiB-like acyl-CoA transferase